MARPRVPKAVAEATAAAAKNPQRFRERRSAKGDELGPAGAWLTRTPGAIAAFNAFRRELPWLLEHHRLLVEMAAELRAMMQGEGLSLQGRQELRRILGQLGATPADESKVGWSGGEEEDPDEAHFAAPGAASRPN